MSVTTIVERSGFSFSRAFQGASVTGPGRPRPAQFVIFPDLKTWPGSGRENFPSPDPNPARRVKCFHRPSPTHHYLVCSLLFVLSFIVCSNVGHKVDFPSSSLLAYSNTSCVPIRFFIAHRVQHSRCSSHFGELYLLTPLS